MIAFQALVSLSSMFILLRIARQWRLRRLGLLRCGIWCAFWTAVAVVVNTPDATQWVADRLGVGRGVDALLYVAILVLFQQLLRLDLKTRALEGHITQLVRELALAQGAQDVSPS
ncbi:MAG: DUF2304 family protein [Oxalobacteraceae bacterium]|nr:MAG: DUF2304 family protein [Oxalobacteraceae bacterium]